MKNIKIQLLLLITLVLLTTQNGSSQNLIAWNSQKSFQFQVDESTKDTIVILRLSKPDLKKFRLYVTQLEHIKIQFEYTQIEYSLLDNKYNLLIKERDNYKSQIALKDSIIGLDQKYILESEEFYKKENKIQYRSGLYKGSIFGIVSGVVLCLLLN